jgi:hypothetical protein
VYGIVPPLGGHMIGLVGLPNERLNTIVVAEPKPPGLNWLGNRACTSAAVAVP